MVLVEASFASLNLRGDGGLGFLLSSSRIPATKGFGARLVIGVASAGDAFGKSLLPFLSLSIVAFLDLRLLCMLSCMICTLHSGFGFRT